MIGFVLASDYRKKVLLALKEKALTPNRIAEKTGIYPTHVSTTLAQLSKMSIVVCLTPKLKKGKLYDLTKEGRGILNSI
jgi:ArsR family transcriptional regulator, cadmium/lead-responsive transcriptional repressor